MHRIFPYIGSMSPVTLHNPGTEMAGSMQPTDISYFVLIPSKKVSGANGTGPADVYELCGTRVVHFPGNVVHVFECTTPWNRNYVSPLKHSYIGLPEPSLSDYD